MGDEPRNQQEIDMRNFRNPVTVVAVGEDGSRSVSVFACWRHARAEARAWGSYWTILIQRS